MNFPYCPVIWIDPSTGELDYTMRPELQLIVHGPRESVVYSALVDTGADDVVLPCSIGRYIGIHLDRSPHNGRAFGGASLDFFSSEVELEIRADGQSLRWTTEVQFLEFNSEDDETLVLGHRGFLNFFTAVFDGDQARLTLNPNARFPIGNPTVSTDS